MDISKVDPTTRFIIHTNIKFTQTHTPHTHEDTHTQSCALHTRYSVAGRAVQNTHTTYAYTHFFDTHINLHTFTQVIPSLVGQFTTHTSHSLTNTHTHTHTQTQLHT